MALALEKVARFKNPRFVVLKTHPTAARRRTVFDDVIHAPLVIDFSRLQHPAGADTESFLHPPQGRAERAGMSKWPEIPVSVFHLQTAQLKARNRIREIYLHHQKPFIIAKTDVVLRAKFLDQLALKEKSLRLVPNKMNLEIPDAVEQCSRLEICRHPARRHKILAEPFSKIPRLADVNNALQAILHQVNARLMRDFA